MKGLIINGSPRIRGNSSRLIEEAVVLIDSWASHEALDTHHHLPLMGRIAALREKYDLHMEVEKHVGIEDEADAEYIRK